MANVLFEGDLAMGSEFSFMHPCIFLRDYPYKKPRTA
jgi:hypothetical protein